MGIKALTNKVNISNSNIAKGTALFNQAKSASYSSIGNTLGIDTSSISRSVAQAHLLSDNIAGITDLMREDASSSASNSPESITGLATDGFLTSKNKNIIKRGKIAPAPKINNLIDLAFGSPPSGKAQTVELLVEKEIPTNIKVGQPGADLIDTNVSELLVSASFLPMPTEISFATDFSWSDNELGVIGTALIERAASIDSLSTATKIALEVGQNAGIGAGEKTLAGILEKVTGTTAAGKALTANRGQVLNPRNAILFDGISYRTFTVDWDLAPKSADESIKIMGLIKLLHIHAAPSLSGSNNYFNYPDIFKFSIKDIQSGHKIIDRGRVAITQISCNYTPDGVWASFANGQPVHVKLSVAFQELELPTKENNIRMLSGISQ